MPHLNIVKTNGGQNDVEADNWIVRIFLAFGLGFPLWASGFAFGWAVCLTLKDWESRAVF